MNFIRRFLTSMSRQISTILAIAAYENDRQSTSSSVGSWESLVNPMQIMFFFIGMRIGFKFLLSGGSIYSGLATDLSFNMVIFMATGFTKDVIALIIVRLLAGLAAPVALGISYVAAVSRDLPPAKAQFQR